MRNVFYFSKKVRLFSQNGVLFLFYFLINPTMTTVFDYNIKKKPDLLCNGVFTLTEAESNTETEK